MDTIRLRTMTYKSILIGGKFDGMTIHQMISLGRFRYLRYTYFKYSALTFIDEILDLINIPKEYRIKKPGSNIELNKELNAKYDEMANGKKNPTSHSIVEKQFKTKKNNRIRREKIYFSKGSMQSRNQGH